MTEDKVNELEKRIENVELRLDVIESIPAIKRILLQQEKRQEKPPKIPKEADFV